MTTTTDDELTIEEVADHVVRIPLPLPIASLRTVNCYAILGSDGVTLIDPGWVSDATAKGLEDGLRAVGTSTADVSQILVTHAHWDHYTQACLWMKERGTTVMLGRGEQPSIEGWDALEGPFPVQVDLLKRAGTPELAAHLEARPADPTEKSTVYGNPTTYLDGGEVIECSPLDIRAISTPGHTRGHMAYEDPANNLLFTGDHILPGITPAIAYERMPDPLALRSYLDSLELCAQRPDARMMPAHRAAGSSVHERALELLDHHATRLALVRELVDSGRQTAYEVASAMTWTRHESSLDDLGKDMGWTAVLEAAAHLDYLVWRGDLAEDESDGVARYRSA